MPAAVAARPPQLGIARELATRHVPTAGRAQSAIEVRKALSSGRFDYAGAVAVLDGERLAGVVLIEQLLSAPADTAMSDLMDSAPPTVTAGSDGEAAV